MRGVGWRFGVLAGGSAGGTCFGSVVLAGLSTGHSYVKVVAAARVTRTALSGQYRSSLQKRINLKKRMSL
jgi:hypothetical protein